MPSLRPRTRPILRRLPSILAVLAALATLVVVGSIAVAVAVLRSSSDAHGPSLAAQILIALLVLALAALAGLLAWAAARIVLRLLGR